MFDGSEVKYIFVIESAGFDGIELVEVELPYHPSSDEIEEIGEAILQEHEADEVLFCIPTNEITRWRARFTGCTLEEAS
jgi:hypothetical protein